MKLTSKMHIKNNGTKGSCNTKTENSHDSQANDCWQARTAGPMCWVTAHMIRSPGTKYGGNSFFPIT